MAIRLNAQFKNNIISVDYDSYLNVNKCRIAAKQFSTMPAQLTKDYFVMRNEMKTRQFPAGDTNNADSSLFLKERAKK